MAYEEKHAKWQRQCNYLGYGLFAGLDFVDEFPGQTVMTTFVRELTTGTIREIER
jgi:hypothetical protein